MNEYLSKPVSLDALTATLARFRSALSSTARQAPFRINRERQMEARPRARPSLHCPQVAMLEIILLYFLCRRMGHLMRAKGIPPLKFQILVPVTWLLGAIAGAALHATFHGQQPPEAGINLYQYLMALLVAVFSVGVLFIVAKGLPPRNGDQTSTGRHP